MALTKIPASLLDTTGGLDLQGNITLGDSEQIQLGADGDLAIYHSGAHSFITDSGIGSLRIQASDLGLETSAGNQNYLTGVDGGAVTIYHNGSPKIATSSTGATVTGNLAVTGDLDITGNVNSASVTDLDVTDKTITLGAGQTEALSGGSGIIIDGSGASILWDETNTEWDFNSRINIPSAFSQYYSIRESGTQYGFIGQYKTLAGTGTDTSLTIFSETGDGINFAVNGSVTKAVVIDAEGDVGIGIDSPGFPLHVNSSSTDVAKFQTSGAYTYTRFQNSSKTWALSIGSDFGFYDEAASATRMIIDSSGNVNIGNGIAEEKRLIIDCSNPLLVLKETDQAVDSKVWATQSIASKLYFRAMNDALSSATEVMILDRSGNVGIGNTGPTNKLSIGQNLGTGFAITADSGTPYGMVLQTDEATPTANPNFWVRTNDGNAVSTLFRIQNDGLVGIGTANPLNPLHIKESGGSHLFALETSYSTDRTGRGQISWRDSGNITGGIWTEYDGTNVSMRFGNLYSSGYNTNTSMIIRGNGNVGIGNNSPAETLHIGSGQSNYIRIHNAASGDIASGLTITRGNTTGLALYDNPFDNTTTFNAIGNINFRTDNTSHRLYIKDNGSVAIGGNANAGHSFEVQDRSDGYSMFWAGRGSSGVGRGLTTSYGLMGVSSTQYDYDGAGYPIAGFGAANDNASHESVDFWFGSTQNEWQPMVIYAIGASTQNTLTGQSAGWACIRATHFNNGISAAIVDSGGGGTFTVSVQGTYGADRANTSRVRVTYEISGNNRTVISAWVASYGGLYGASRA